MKCWKSVLRLPRGLEVNHSLRIPQGERSTARAESLHLGFALAVGCLPAGRPTVFGMPGTFGREFLVALCASAVDIVTHFIHLDDLRNKLGADPQEKCYASRAP